MYWQRPSVIVIVSRLEGIKTNNSRFIKVCLHLNFANTTYYNNYYTYFFLNLTLGKLSANQYFYFRLKKQVYAKFSV